MYHDDDNLKTPFGKVRLERITGATTEELLQLAQRNEFFLDLGAKILADLRADSRGLHWPWTYIRLWHERREIQKRQDTLRIILQHALSELDTRKVTR